MFGSGDRSIAASIGRNISKPRGPCCCVELFCCGRPSCNKMVHKLEMTPNGAWSAWPVAVSTLAWILSMSSVAACSFLTRSVSVKSEVEGSVADMSLLLLHDHGVGFWGWEAEGSCYSYNINGNDPSFDGAYKASNAFTTLTTFFGGIGTMYCWLGTCFPVKPSRYEQIGYVFLLTSVFDISTLVIMASSMCDPGFFDYAIPGVSLGQLMSTSCGMGAGSILALVASIFWAIAACICLRSPLASETRTTLRQIDPSLMQQYQDDEQPQDDDSFDADRVLREEETERRYRNMFGENSDEEEEDYYQTNGGQGFQTSLAQVQEEDFDDDDYKSDRQSGRNPFDDEESRGSRSQYSQEVRSRYSQEDDDEQRSFFSGEDRSQSNHLREERSSHSAARSGRVCNDSASQGSFSMDSQSQGSELV